MQFQQQTAAWSRCQRGPVRNMFCSGTFTLAQGSAGRLCTGAVVATETDSPQDKSATVGVGWGGAVGGTNQITHEIYCNS